MADPVGIELVEWVQSGIGWTILAARVTRPLAPTPASVTTAHPEASAGAPLRLRATITIDIDARDTGEAAQESDAVRNQFEILKQALPSAELAFQRRKPRTGRRPPTPTLVVSPYVDD